MRTWTDTIDPATIPMEVIRHEWYRRASLARKTFTGGRNGGRPRKTYKCARCKAQIEGSREFAAHQC